MHMLFALVCFTEVVLLGDYTLSGMVKEQEALLRRLIKCGMESDP